MIADSVAFLRRPGQAKWSTTPSISSTATRDDPDYALRCLRAAAEAGAETVVLCDTNGGIAARRTSPGAMRRGAPPRVGGAPGWASTATTTPAAASPTPSPPSRPAPPTCRARINGYGERCGNANLVSIIANLQLKLGLPLPGPTTSWRASPRSRTSSTSCQPERPTPTSPTSAATRSPTRAGMHVAGVNAGPRTYEHIDPDARRQRARAAGLASSPGKGTVARPRRGGGSTLDEDGGPAGGGPGQGARAPRLPLRGRRRVVRAAAAQGDGRATSRCSPGVAGG